MKIFSISRIDTDLGILRLAGRFFSTKPNLVITYHQVEFMSTYGWCELDIDSARGKLLPKSIEGEIAAHLIV